MTSDLISYYLLPLFLVGYNILLCSFLLTHRKADYLVDVDVWRSTSSLSKMKEMYSHIIFHTHSVIVLFKILFLPFYTYIGGYISGGSKREIRVKESVKLKEEEKKKEELSGFCTAYLYIRALSKRKQ